MKKSKVLNKNGLTEEQFLDCYDPNQYDRPSVTVDMLIFTITAKLNSNYRKLSNKELRLLMIRRGEHPYIGQWALPGGFVRSYESLDEAAIRVLKEETNIDNVYMEQLYTWGEINRDPRTRVISASYMSLLDSSSLNIKASQDVEEAQWFTVKCKLLKENKTITDKGYIIDKEYLLTLNNQEVTEKELSAVIKVIKTVEGKVWKIDRTVVESNGIAFDHGKIIEYGIERLRNKIEYSDIAFNLMPELFTLTELQQVYEVILDKELLKANFRRKISGMVIETEEFTKDAGHRPSKLFKYNPDWYKEKFNE